MDSRGRSQDRRRRSPEKRGRVPLRRKSKEGISEEERTRKHYNEVHDLARPYKPAGRHGTEPRPPATERLRRDEIDVMLHIETGDDVEKKKLEIEEERRMAGKVSGPGPKMRRVKWWKEGMSEVTSTRGSFAAELLLGKRKDGKTPKADDGVYRHFTLQPVAKYGVGLGCYRTSTACTRFLWEHTLGIPVYCIKSSGCDCCCSWCVNWMGLCCSIGTSPCKGCCITNHLVYIEARETAGADPWILMARQERSRAARCFGCAEGEFALYTGEGLPVLRARRPPCSHRGILLKDPGNVEFAEWGGLYCDEWLWKLGSDCFHCRLDACWWLVCCHRKHMPVDAIVDPKTSLVTEVLAPTCFNPRERHGCWNPVEVPSITSHEVRFDAIQTERPSSAVLVARGLSCRGDPRLHVPMDAYAPFVAKKGSKKGSPFRKSEPRRAATYEETKEGVASDRRVASGSKDLEQTKTYRYRAVGKATEVDLKGSIYMRTRAATLLYAISFALENM